jgi:hypothetical protein
VIGHRLLVGWPALPARDIGGEKWEGGKFGGAAQPTQHGDHHQVADGEFDSIEPDVVAERGLEIGEACLQVGDDFDMA